MESGVLSPTSWLDEEISVLEAVYGDDVSHERGPEALVVHSRLAPQIDEQKVGGICSIYWLRALARMHRLFKLGKRARRVAHR